MSFLPVLRTILKLIIASEAFKTLMAALLDWLCARIAKTGEWLIKKTQERKKKYIDDDDLFE
ncbi:MAG TPA: hypothetical protein O0Y17_03830 [Methanocorpusculum sp.]|nr:hypothetical protein [Methanocorpusculum sp.]